MCFKYRHYNTADVICVKTNQTVQKERVGEERRGDEEGGREEGRRAELTGRLTFCPVRIL